MPGQLSREQKIRDWWHDWETSRCMSWGPITRAGQSPIGIEYEITGSNTLRGLELVCSAIHSCENSESSPPKRCYGFKGSHSVSGIPNREQLGVHPARRTSASKISMRTSRPARSKSAWRRIDYFLRCYREEVIRTPLNPAQPCILLPLSHDDGGNTKNLENIFKSKSIGCILSPSSNPGCWLVSPLETLIPK